LPQQPSVFIREGRERCHHVLKYKIQVNFVYSTLVSLMSFLLQEYPGTASSLWRSNFVVDAQIEHKREREVEREREGERERERERGACRSRSSSC
jgi:hypothetical protein